MLDPHIFKGLALPLILIFSGCGDKDARAVPNVVDMSSKYKSASSASNKVVNCDAADHLKPNGNRHVRYLDFCRSGLQILFTAVPEGEAGYSLHYTAWVTNKAGVDCFGTEDDFANFGPDSLKKSVGEQLTAIKHSWRPKINEINKICGDKLNLEELFDEDFYRAYIEYGDGWWISDPKAEKDKMSEFLNAQTH